ncbi:MAG TPA: hypothetical protein VEX86_17520 [Longimicrobium sp.]|nr:hypothetical protein [Longimicrobium sp.]
MRRIGRWLAVVAAVGTAGCSPGLLSGGMRVNPGCSGMQAYRYQTTSQFTVRQKVSAIQSRYSPSYSYMVKSPMTWKSASSGECR